MTTPESDGTTLPFPGSAPAAPATEPVPAPAPGSGAPAPMAPGSKDPAPGDPADRKPLPLVGTVVWGLVLAFLALLTIVVRQSGIVLDLGQTLIWLLLGAGLAMVVGGALSLGRRKR
ncbi:hypothetical protein ACQCSX_10790 [Pseudarthrobacter sp. P1]|uniref:hypothetical protein n=1 Tax=Pseudarthrobacter sp. P1 TaxID=3418418 RepID=UPI003CF9ECCC